MSELDDILAGDIKVWPDNDEYGPEAKPRIKALFRKVIDRAKYGGARHSTPDGGWDETRLVSSLYEEVDKL